MMTYANYYLKDYLFIHDYVITRHGWQMIIRTKTKDLISLKNTDGKVREELFWRMISERIRLFISTYVKCVNRSRGRTGTLVHSNYRRYYFEELEEAEEHLSKVRRQQVKLYQDKKKYRGIKRHYCISKDEELGSVYLCSKELKEFGRKREVVQVIRHVDDFVLPELVDKTKFLHARGCSPNKTTNSP